MYIFSDRSPGLLCGASSNHASVDILMFFCVPAPACCCSCNHIRSRGLQLVGVLTVLAQPHLGASIFASRHGFPSPPGEMEATSQEVVDVVVNIVLAIAVFDFGVVVAAAFFCDDGSRKLIAPLSLVLPGSRTSVSLSPSPNSITADSFRKLYATNTAFLRCTQAIRRSLRRQRGSRRAACTQTAYPVLPNVTSK